MTKELIKVTVKNDQQLVSARDLYKGLELKIRFSLWTSKNFKDFEEGEDFTTVSTNTVVNNGAKRELQDYALTLDMAKQLCMMSHSELGKKYRRYFIELERKWNDPQEIVKRGYAILQNENAKLNSLGVQYKLEGTWMLYHEYQVKGWARIQITIETKTEINVEWTRKGRLGLYELLKQNGILPLIEQKAVSA